MSQSRKDLFDTLIERIIALDEKESRRIAEEMVKAGIPAYDVIVKGLAVGMQEVGRKYETGESFLAELVMAGVVANNLVDALTPQLSVEKKGSKGVVLMGTVEGDLHDIGKNLVITLLRAAGFEVHDLGTDVSPERFVEGAKQISPDVIGMSSLLTSTIPKIGGIIEALKTAEIRDNLKVILGGRAVTQSTAKEFGADAYADDAVKGVRIIQSWSES